MHSVNQMINLVFEFQNPNFSSDSELFEKKSK